MNRIIDETKKKMGAAVDHFKEELKKMRSSRAQPSMLENVMVEVYGSQMRIRDIATISAPEPRQLVITPFDPQSAGAIRKGIESANLNLTPILDGNQVRVPVPPMDESVRKETVKVIKKKGEDSKVTLRDIRRKGNESVRRERLDGDVTEDEVKKTEKGIQDLTDKYCKEIDDLIAMKEKEIMTV